MNRAATTAWGLALDPRVKLLNVLVVSTLAFALPGQLASLSLLLVGMLFALVVGRPDIALVTALRAMRLPQELVIAIAVMLRFIPSFQQDVQSIAQGMRTRAVGVTPLRLVRHPALVYEGFVVPLIMRALMTSTELAASAETRGINCPCQKTSYLVVRFTARDLVACLVLVAAYATIVGLLASGMMTSS